MSSPWNTFIICSEILLSQVFWGLWCSIKSHIINVIVMHLTKILLENLKKSHWDIIGWDRIISSENFCWKLTMVCMYLFKKNPVNYWFSNWDLLLMTKNNLFPGIMISDCTWMHLFETYLFWSQKPIILIMDRSVTKTDYCKWAFMTVSFRMCSGFADKLHLRLYHCPLLVEKLTPLTGNILLHILSCDFN